MICDWVGAGRAQGKHSPKDDRYKEVREWWNRNYLKMRFGKKTWDKIINILYGLEERVNNNFDDIKEIIRDKPIEQLTKELKEAGVKFIDHKDDLWDRIRKVADEVDSWHEWKKKCVSLLRWDERLRE